MTGQIIPLHGDEHDQVRLLLPWYVTERLDEADRAEFEAHLAGCPECQAEVVRERRLRAAVAATPAPAAAEAGAAWAAFSANLPAAPGQPARRPKHRRKASAWRGWTPLAASVSGWRVGVGTVGWMAAAHVATLALLTTVVLMRPQPQSPSAIAGYHALGAAPVAAAPGNLLVIFKPETPEKDLRAILTANDLKLVEGPTAADAWVLRAAPERRAGVLTALRARREIVMAEPIDAAAPGR